jgi:anti-sigma B factor antagonist
MNLPARTVIVEQLPETSDPRRERIFLRQLASNMEQVIRPYVVLDCGCMRNVDSAGLHLLLCCLEEAMKRNGDVRLAAVPEQAQAAFRALGINRLFRAYSSVVEATESFRRPAKFRTTMALEDAVIEPPAANAA